MPNPMDMFISAVSSGDAQGAGSLLEQLAASKGMPPGLVSQAGQSVGLVKLSTGWSFQDQVDTSQLASLAQKNKDKQEVATTPPPNPTSPLPVPTISPTGQLGGIQNG